jgi:hypothetical protein
VYFWGRESIIRLHARVKQVEKEQGKSRGKLFLGQVQSNFKPALSGLLKCMCFIYLYTSEVNFNNIHRDARGLAIGGGRKLGKASRPGRLNGPPIIRPINNSISLMDFAPRRAIKNCSAGFPHKLFCGVTSRAKYCMLTTEKYFNHVHFCIHQSSF